MKPLAPKQARFADEYLIDLNATQAAIRAGYSIKSAHVEGARLLKNAKVAAEIAKAQLQRQERTGITADRVLQELALIGFSDMRKFAKWGASGVTLLDSAALDADSARCVAEVSETTSEGGGSIKFKLHDKPAALVSIGRHLGMFTEKHEHRFPDLPRDQAVNRVAALLSEAKARKSSNGNGVHASSGNGTHR